MLNIFFINTAVAQSKITYINGDTGVLRYRGYPIEQLAEKSTYIEVAYLLIYGELPSKQHGVAAMSTFHPDANPALAGSDLFIRDEKVRNKQIFRLLVNHQPWQRDMAYRHRIGRVYNVPQNNLSYTENFLYMLDRLSEENYKPSPKLAKALDVLFILHADHELNCSTAAMRHICSSLVDPYSAIAGASAALYGPLHGGANEECWKKLDQLIKVYKNYDPRAKIIRNIAYEVFDVCGRESLIDVAVVLEKAALEDEYFVKRKLYPNVLWWLAHWKESLESKDAKIWRPRQVYVGPNVRSDIPLELREEESNYDVTNFTDPFTKTFSKRSLVADFDNKNDKKPVSKL
ncbi:unnamed protein product [Rhizophagus irregularis]|nr:unnamed protein product [Rhizophagus irregularis]